MNLQLLKNKVQLPLAAVSKRTSKHFYAFFPHLVLLTYVLLLIDAVSYPGFVNKTLFIPVEFFFGITIIFFLLFRFFGGDKSKTNTFYNYFMYLNQTLTLPLILLFYIFNSLEHFNFPNYVFSTFHLHLKGLEKIVILNVILSIFSSKLVVSKLIPSHVSKSLSLSSMTEVLFVLCVFWIFMLNAWSFVKYINGSIISYSETFGMSTEEKLVRQLGGNELSGWVYTYGEFINRHTPQDARIIIPPQLESWQMEGNPWYFRWFVYPRRLLSTQKIIQPFPEEGEYILIAHGAWIWGATQFVWPRVTIPAEQIEYITLINRSTLEETTVVGQAYVPNTTETWGIIKLKR